MTLNYSKTPNLSKRSSTNPSTGKSEFSSSILCWPGAHGQEGEQPSLSTCHVLTLLSLKPYLPSAQSHQVSTAFPWNPGNISLVNALSGADLVVEEPLHETKHELHFRKNLNEAAEVTYGVLTSHDSKTLEFSKYSHKIFLVSAL